MDSVLNSDRSSFSGAALIATLIYRQLAREENDQSYLHPATEFESLAVQILDKFYQANRKACTKAIIRQIPAYGNVTWLELAVAAQAKEFIAHRGVQDVLNNIWFVPSQHLYNDLFTLPNDFLQVWIHRSKCQ